MPQLKLVAPDHTYLGGFVDALRTGWSPSNARDVSAEVLAAVEADASGYIAGLFTTDGLYRHPNGTMVPRLPMLTRWLWDGEFCGVISLRWQPDTSALPAHVSGHIGYSVVPWKRRLGYATLALREMLLQAERVGLPQVEITTDLDNVASQRVILKCGGILVTTRPPDEFSPTPKNLFIVHLDG